MKQFNSAKSNSDKKLNFAYKAICLSSILAVVLLPAFSITSCTKQKDGNTGTSSPITETKKQAEELGSLYANSGLSSQTLSELDEVKAATAKYNTIDNAFKDQYLDIGLKMPNMGYHFLKSQLVAPVFNLRKPAILVYNKKDNGNYELVAVEYAVPIDSSQLHTPPQGFTGDADEWDFNTLNTGWWTLHAWVWKFNPDGVFKPMNPDVIVK